VPAAFATVNVTVAMPDAFVVLVVAGVNEPPFVLVHVTTRPASNTATPPASANCVVMVTAVPTVALVALVVTRYFVATRCVDVIAGVLPVSAPVVAVTTWLEAGVFDTVNVTVAMPDAFVVLVVAGVNDPPFVLVHVTVCPCVDTGLLAASANCAVIVTVVPTIALVALVVTRYLVATGAAGVVVIAGVLPVSAPVVAVTT
jgi:hypothetical protein